MHIRPAAPADLEFVADIDGTIESSDYLHVERSGEGLSIGWKLESRPLRSKLIAPNPMTDEAMLLLKQIVTGADEGIALVAEHEGAPVALALAQPRPEFGSIHLHDLRVDYDHRRQGIATVLVYQVIQQARDTGLRAVSAESRSNNFPAAKLLQKLAFELAGLDTHHHTNHDLVKESATLFWYAALD
ncbi:MAG TPA: GNAT family N-acetyltransferase [Tepidisphaeraceae bacterium]|jgi:ribosomal protein S18 acetylase RimI-like enzyme